MYDKRPTRYVNRSFFISQNLDEIAEQVRKELGLNRSQFIRHCLTFYFEEHSIISTQLESVKENIRNSKIAEATV